MLLFNKVTKKYFPPPIPCELHDKHYHPSGKWKLSSLFIVVILGIPLSSLVGLAGHYIGIYSNYPIAVLAAFVFFGSAFCIFLGRTDWVILGWLFCVLLLYFGFPFIVGLILALLTWGLCRWQKIRNPLISLLSGLVNGIAGYFVLQLFRFREFGILRLMSLFDIWLINTKNASGSNFFLSHELMLPPNDWHYLAILIEISFFLFITASIPYWLTIGTPFCERCGKWYSKWLIKDIKYPQIWASEEENQSEGILYLLTDDLHERGKILEAINQIWKINLQKKINRIPFTIEEPYIKLGLRKCNSCDTVDYQILVNIVVENPIFSKTLLIAPPLFCKFFREKTCGCLEWINAMVPTKLGMQLEQIFFSEST